MSVSNDMWTIAVGAATVIVGLKTKRFYPTSGGIYLNKSVPHRPGMILFLVVGGFLLVFGIARLLTDLRP